MADVTIPGEAVAAAAKAIETRVKMYVVESRKPYEPAPVGASMAELATVALEAAAPAILAAQRERIADAAELMADELEYDHFYGPADQSRQYTKDLLHRLAAVARGESDG